MKFTEARLEAAIIELLEGQGYPHQRGDGLSRASQSDVLLKDDLRDYLSQRYAAEAITSGEITTIINKLERLPACDLYASNRTIHRLVADGFLLKRDDRSQKDLYIELIDYASLPAQRPPDASKLLTITAESRATYHVDRNIYRMVNQLTITGTETRIPDGILYINGLPCVLFEFKSAIRTDATLHDAYVQITTRYIRDIPELLKYNALCVISDGVNTRMGSLFAPYDHFYTWRKVTGNEPIEQEGINALYSMISGLFDKSRLLQLMRHFIYFPDSGKQEIKIVCRYPQFYAANKLYHHIIRQRKRIDSTGHNSGGDGKGGTYFGATGCGKSYTMLFLSRLLMKSLDLASPTIILITDRNDLDEQLSALFGAAKDYIGDNHIHSVSSRADLRERLRGLKSGGVFLTTIHKFTEDTELLSERDNIICISDEAHRSQINLEQKVRRTKQGVERRYGFAKYLHDSLPNATYVGFTGTPIDATLDVFGPVVDAYTMTESVQDEITVRIVYEGRAAKVILDNQKLAEIEAYYAKAAKEGASEHAIEASKKASANMSVILGDPDRIKVLAADFVQHYERRVTEGATVNGCAMVVSSRREIAYAFWQALIALRPDWNKALTAAPGAELSEQQAAKLLPIERVKMVMTRRKDDPTALYELLGTSKQRERLARQFKNRDSNFKIAIVVDMWLTGFDVPFLDTIYIDKPIKRHNLIQAISRVNRTVAGKEKGLVVDYIGIKKQMNLALAQYNQADQQNFEEIGQSIAVVRDHLKLLRGIFHGFDDRPYFEGSPLAQLHCLNHAADYVQRTETLEKQFMALVKRLKAAYDICTGSEEVRQQERDRIHFYLAVRAILFKLTKGDAPDTTQMNAKVRHLIAEALKADGVEEIFRLGHESATTTDLFDADYLAKLANIKLPNTRIKLLQQLLAKAIQRLKRTNRAKSIDFAQRFETLVNHYNERSEQDVLVSNVLDDFSSEIIDLINALQREKESFTDLGIDLEEKAFYDILKRLTVKHKFSYPKEKLLTLAKAVKLAVAERVQYTDWNQREDIKSGLKVALILLLAKHGYPPVDRDEVYKEIFEQAANFEN